MRQTVRYNLLAYYGGLIVKRLQGGNTMKNILYSAFASALFLSAIFPAAVKADGCYICGGQSGTYVKFTGSDNFEKRKEAEKCGCKISGTTSSCNAANYTILCSVWNDPAARYLFALNKNK
jgi:hypothetical protein